MRALLLSTLALALVAGAAQAAPKAEGAWSRPAAQGTTGVGFMTLVNPDAKADALVSVQTPLAREVQIHQTRVVDGIASMTRLDRVAVPAGGRVAFAPGGYHLMLMGLTRPLKPGDTAPATLTFASGAKVKVSFVVGSAPPASGGHAH